MSRRLIALALTLIVVHTIGSDRGITADPGLNSHVRGLVLFVGDSNVTLSATNIDWALTWQNHGDNGYVPVLASRVGSSIRTHDCLEPIGCTTTDYWATKLGELLPKLSVDVVVNNLGINDTASVGTPTTPGYASYTEKIDWLMELIPTNTPVIWTNLPCKIEPKSRAAGCAAINEALSLARGRWRNLILVDWNAAASGHPEYMANPGVDVHLSPLGRAKWTRAVLAVLDGLFPLPVR